MMKVIPTKDKFFYLRYSVSEWISISSKRIEERTKRLEMVSINFGSINLSIWNMVGQDECHTFHDLIIPNFNDVESIRFFILTYLLTISKGNEKSCEKLRKRFYIGCKFYHLIQEHLEIKSYMWLWYLLMLIGCQRIETLNNI